MGWDGVRDIKKSYGVFCEGVVVKYVWIKEYCDFFLVVVMSCVLRVSMSGYYKWLNGKLSFWVEWL